MRIRYLVAIVAAAMLGLLPSSAAFGRLDRITARADGSETAPAMVALDWNANAVAAVRAATVVDPLGGAPRPIYQTEGLLYMSYVQAAVYDAATKIGHRYGPYHHFSAAAGNASIEAAVIAAAYNTLVYFLPGQSAALRAEYDASIAALPNDRRTTRGIAVGQAAAADIAALRLNDGRYAPVSTAYGAGPLQPGLWVWAPPPSLQVAQTPWMAFMQPFMLHSTSQFRAPPPPALTSTLYTDNFNETKAFGSKNSAVRTPDQTNTALFWNANAINQVNQALRDAAVQHGMDLVDAARLLAMGNMIPTDAGMACFDSKYTYQFWRPITAIRNADIDGNPATTADPTWTPLVTTPNHPEYPSQHGCVTSALAQVLADVAGSSNFNATFWGAQGGASTLTTTRTFPAVQDLLTELVNARVWMGFHFRNSVIAGEDLGSAVANWELQRFFLPTDEGED